MFTKIFIISIVLITSINISFSQTLNKSKIRSDTTKLDKLSSMPAFLEGLIEDVIIQETQKKADLLLEIDGLLIDDTKTKSGRDFYDLYYRDWIAPPEANNYTIYVNEKPFRLNTTIIEILINDVLIYEAFLQPRTEYVEELAVQCIGLTQQYLIQYEQLVRELDGDERKGTGIF